ncbi:hypothetical protein F443_10397 [Phytophthora nicotianae P1569]|uniref:FAR1 domain-containing protein n=1 Tax=Phytophthora nicotianae P1569 TaxID=1317065 RepID=V9F2J7_PHYNI|nr:hypothetical protein F443_10397 [Phytophthora nicotianae P1569]
MDEQAAPATYTITLVPPNDYLAEREAEVVIHQWTRVHNYNMSRQKVEKNKNEEIRYRRFACDRSGKAKKTQEK